MGHMLESSLWDEIGSHFMVAVGRLLHCLHCLTGIVLLLCGASASAATAYVFDGRPVPDCYFSQMAYFCPSLSMGDQLDSIDIADRYQVYVYGSLVFGENQGLKMTGTARLYSFGDIDISAIKAAKLRVTGGSIESNKTFKMGAVAQSFTASVKADDVVLGSGAAASVTGTIEAARTVTIGANMTVTGTITSPKVDVLPSGVRLTGNIVATGAVTLGSGSTVTGNVTADTLTLQSSSAYISGNATVRHATLGPAGRVAGKIYCTQGNTNGGCDCVTNNSGYAVNSSNGPSCPYVAGPGAHHFRVTHPVGGATCMPSTVTVTACANAACTAPHFTGGTSVTLLPGNKTFAINSSGVNDAATVEQGAGGDAFITTSPSSSSLTCVGTGGATNTSDCKITFASSALVVDIGDHAAETSKSFTVSAVQNGSAGAAGCAAAFMGSKSVAFSCAYINPGTGTLPVRINNTSLSCNGSTQSVALSFSSAGKATAALQYADAGTVRVTATVASPALTGNDSFTAAPASFLVSAPATATGKIKAGETFEATVTAKNSEGATTPNFGRETTSETVSMTHTLCAPSPSATPAGVAGTLTSSVGPVTGGTAKATLTWSEVGQIELTATLKSNNYLSSGLSAAGNTSNASSVTSAAPATAACSGGGRVGRFTPDHFDVTIAKPLGFYYSGQPLTISSVVARGPTPAMGLAPVMQNYAGAVHAKEVTLTVLDSAGAASNPGPGSFRPSLTSAAVSPVTIAASRFVAGSGTPASAPVYKFGTALTAPTTIRLRATDSDGISSATGIEGTALVRSGRLRLFGAFGRSGADLSLPFRTEYWTGASWLLNAQDSTPIPVLALALTPSSTMTGASVVSISPLVAGQGTIVIRPPVKDREKGTGIVELAVNLGLTSPSVNTQNLSCLSSTRPFNRGADMPWLRSLNGNCNRRYEGDPAAYETDPAARATFGVDSPERRRLIHVREVFR